MYDLSPTQEEARRQHQEEEAAAYRKYEMEEAKYEAAKAADVDYQAAVKAYQEASEFEINEALLAMEMEEEKFDCKYHGYEFDLQEFLKYNKEPMPDEGGNGPGLIAQIDADHKYEAMDCW